MVVKKAVTDTVAIEDNTRPSAASFVATDLTNVTITFNEDIKVIGDITDEVKLYDADQDKVEFTSATVTDGKLVLTVSDSTSIVAVDTIEVNDADLVDEAGNAINKVSLPIK